jgi:SAM-dependent methyltransferase
MDGIVFDTVAELYDRVRPGYPEAVFDDITELGGLAPGSRVVEVGPGTGQATRSLLRRGWSVTAIEPGPSLAAVAAERFADDPNVSITVSRFEDWTPPTDRRYDAVFSATAWHWIDPAQRYRKAASMLRPAGALAIIETHHVCPPDGDRFFAEIQDVYDEIGESGPPDGPAPPDEVGERLTAEIADSGCFETPRTRRHVWSRSYSAEEYIDVLRTYSGHIVMTDRQRDRLFGAIRERIGSRDRPIVEKHYLNIVYVAARR